MSPLATWPQLAPTYGGGALLTGNGASRSIWPGFEYDSLLDVAASDAIDHPLTAEDVALFDELGVFDFETVLERLSTAVSVLRALDRPTGYLRARYASIKRALVESVHALHAPWDDVPDETLEGVAAAMRTYRSVFTTNYDLLSYWAAMTDVDGFADYFWGPGHSFSPARTWVEEGRTRLLFLHGGLHLVKRNGIGRKLVHNGRNLLAQFGGDAGAESLFVSEGTSAMKLGAIQASAYLAFAYHELASDSGPFCVFGQALSAADAHIAVALDRPGLRIAIGLRPKTPDHLDAARAHYRQRLQRPTLRFFDATTHPLGAPELLVG